MGSANLLFTGIRIVEESSFFIYSNCLEYTNSLILRYHFISFSSIYSFVHVYAHKFIKVHLVNN